MSDKLIFLSHITEEKKLAKIIKDAIEDEFSGFVKVFVSSDGETIKAGQNFLKVIEDGLVDCIAAIYLISPISVQRSWISFELGAVWIRNTISQRKGDIEIPALPFCHSGMNFKDLPQPICNLNSIEANLSSKLEFAFKSLQMAVGGRGRLKTDFDALADQVVEFEKDYMLVDKVTTILELFGVDAENKKNLKQQVGIATLKNFTIKTSTEQVIADQIFKIIDGGLNHVVSYQIGGSRMGGGTRGIHTYVDVDINFNIDLLRTALNR
jgi:hypothetical protein